MQRNSAERTALRTTERPNLQLWYFGVSSPSGAHGGAGGGDENSVRVVARRTSVVYTQWSSTYLLVVSTGRLNILSTYEGDDTQCI